MGSAITQVAGLAMAGILLWGCSEPTSNSTAPGQPSFVARALRSAAAVELIGIAKLVDNGSVTITLRAGCPRGFHVVEGPVSVIQGPEFQEIFGEGFFTVRCDGHWHVRKVNVRAPEASFQRGTARASASFDVENPETGEFLSASDGEVVRIR
jgi:hypothetical protein